MSEAAPVVTRFHELLVEEIRSRKPQYLSGPFTVAEIYQDLVPYQTHRDRLGVRMNGDYEHALVRLLAGEGGYLHIDSEAALRELREELEASNPNTGIYREFAAVDVRLGSAGRDGAAEAPLRPPASPAAGAPESDRGRVAPQGPAGRRSTGVRASTELPAAGAAGSGTCRWCQVDLPDRENVRFCPFCGGDVNVVPCPQCGEELDADWRFCIACGAPVEHP